MLVQQLTKTLNFKNVEALATNCSLYCQKRVKLKDEKITSKKQKREKQSVKNKAKIGKTKKIK